MPSNPTALNETLDKTLAHLQSLIEVVAKLRDPEGGCPWDLEQTSDSLVPYIIEEAYETVDAIRGGDRKAIAEELGDLLLQVVLQAQIAQDNQDFDLGAVAQGITEKLVRRHPHVFGDVEAKDAETVKRNWDAIKASESPDKRPELLSYRLGRIARSLPPLEAGLKISQKAAKIGFEWEKVEDVWTKFEEELGEFRHALDHEDGSAQAGEFGDLMFSLIQLARWHGIDPSRAIHGTNQRFVARLEQMETLGDRPLTDYTLQELEALWQKAKRKLGQGSKP
jgi:XTP/dITP diphosphohydrolase